MSRRQRVVIQLLGPQWGGQSGLAPSFSPMRFTCDLPKVIYTEQLTSAQYLDRPDDLDEYKRILRQTRRDGTAPKEVDRKARRDALGGSDTLDGLKNVRHPTP